MQTLHDKHKIEKKVREHLRKQRKDMKRNPLKYHRKDPGIPNSWPFKQQLLQQQEQQRDDARAAMAAAREAKILERQRQRQAEAAVQAASRMTAQQRRELRRRKAAFAPVHDVLADADVVLIVLDARDPAACRSVALEKALLECGKLPILLLNKCDLVPKANLDGWMASLGASLPTLPFCCPTKDVEAAAAEATAKAVTKAPPAGKRLSKKQAHAQAAAQAAAAEAAKSKAAGGARASVPKEVVDGLAAVLRARREVLAAATGTKELPTLAVGAIGFDRVGKRSVLRTIREAAEAAAEAADEEAASPFDGVQLLTLPALLSPNLEASGGLGLNDVLLRRASAEHVPQPEATVDTWIKRCVRRSVLRHFGMADFGETHEFLAHFAEREKLPQPRTLPGSTSLVDARPAALGFLKFLSAGRLAFCTAAPPAPPGAAASLDAPLLGKKWAKAAPGILGPAAAAAVAPAGSKAAEAAALAVEMAPGVADEFELEAEEEGEEMADEGESEGEEEEEGESGEEGEEEEGEEEEDDDDEEEED